MEEVLIPFTFPAPYTKLGGLLALADDGLMLEYQIKAWFSIRAKSRKIPFREIVELRVRWIRQGWLRRQEVEIEICTRNLQTLHGVPGSIRERLSLRTGREHFDLARCLEQVLVLKLMDR